MFRALKDRFKRVKNFFAKTHFSLGKKLRSLLGKRDDDSFEELERLFFESDLGARLSFDLVEKVRYLRKKDPEITTDKILEEIKKEISSILGAAPALSYTETKPHVIMIVGTNGSGKTTTIAKLAKYYSEEGKKVLLSASDTFRAAAVEQIDTWAKRLGIDIVTSQKGADPSSVVFDTLTSALSKNYDIVLVDTAGRLHTKTELMDELNKILRVTKKKIADAPHETLLVLDATIGQNALDQVEAFHKYTPLTSIVLTKLDGSAKGGVIVALKKEKDIPVKWIGLGEGEDDLELFDPDSFVEALFKES